jgi:hypothetical protein
MKTAVIGRPLGPFPLLLTLMPATHHPFRKGPFCGPQSRVTLCNTHRMGFPGERNGRHSSRPQMGPPGFRADLVCAMPSRHNVLAGSRWFRGDGVESSAATIHEEGYTHGSNRNR